GTGAVGPRPPRPRKPAPRRLRATAPAPRSARRALPGRRVGAPRRGAPEAARHAGRAPRPSRRCLSSAAGDRARFRPRDRVRARRARRHRRAPSADRPGSRRRLARHDRRAAGFGDRRGRRPAGRLPGGIGDALMQLRVWAPGPERVDAVVGEQRLAMTKDDADWWSVDAPGAGPGTDYAFSLDGGDPLPDPRSRWQPSGVHGPSRLVDHSTFAWSGARPKVDLAETVFYELHVGTFSEAGTFDGAIEHVDHIVGLRVTA